MPAYDDVGLEDEPLRHEIDLLGESMAAKPAPRIVSTMRRSMTRKGRGRAAPKITTRPLNRRE